MTTEMPEMTGASVPAACSLPAADRPGRLAELDELFATFVRRVDRAEPGRLRLELLATPEVAARTADLVTREAACCSFFTFTLTATTGELLLDIVVPEAWREVLDTLAGRATAA
jgi:hypothetical protein